MEKTGYVGAEGQSLRDDKSNTKGEAKPTETVCKILDRL